MTVEDEKEREANTRITSDVRAGRSGSRLMEFSRVPSCRIAGLSADLGHPRLRSVLSVLPSLAHSW